MNVIQANQHLLRLIDHDYKDILYGIRRFVNKVLRTNFNSFSNVMRPFIIILH